MEKKKLNNTIFEFMKSKKSATKISDRFASARSIKL